MTEDELKRAVLDMCKLLHLKVAHFRPARLADGSWRTPVEADGKGFPDLVVAGSGGVLYRELKAEGKDPTAEQREWLSVLLAAGADADVWRPRHLASGRILRELKTCAGKTERQLYN